MSFLPKKLLKYLAFNCQPRTKQPSQKKIKTAKYTDKEALFVEEFLQKQAVTLLFRLRKICVVLCP
jgi:hypothetical protein